MTILQTDAAVIFQQNLIGGILAQREPAFMGLRHHSQFCPDARSPMVLTAGAVSHPVQKRILSLTAVGGHREGKRRILRQIGLHLTALHQKINCIRVVFSAYRHALQYSFTVLVVGLCRDHPIDSVQLQLDGGVHVYAHIGDRHQKQGVSADSYSQSQHGGTDRIGSHGQPARSSALAPLHFLSPPGLLQEASGSCLQLLAGLQYIKGSLDPVLCVHHESPPSVSFSSIRPRDKSE